jgi:hypothetical protein
MSTKISEFTTSGISLTSDITFVTGGTNFKAPVSDLATLLGTTGSLTSIGETLAIPVLTQPSTSDNQIRKLLAGSGVAVALSAQNGINLKHNFTFNKTGEPLVVSETALSPIFKSIVGTGGITASTNGSTLEIAGNISTNGVVQIETIADFPAAVAGVITLVANTTYLLTASVSTNNRFVMAANVEMTSANILANTLTYTGPNDMFTAVDINVFFDNLILAAPAGQVFNISAVSNPFVQLFIQNMLISSCAKIGTFDDLAAMDIFNSSMIAAADGVTLTGATNWKSLLINKVGIAGTSVSFAAVDFGTVVFDTVRIGNISITGPVGAMALKGLPNSGNMSAGSLGTITNNSISGGITTSTTILPSDIRWDFFGNNFTADSIDDALLSFNANSTETVIASSGVAVLVNATWTLDDTSRFTTTEAGRATYVGERTKHLPMDIAVGLVPVGGGTKDATISIYLNGSVIANTSRTISVSGTTALGLSIPWQLTLEEDDYLEVFVSNDTDTANIIVEHATMRIN